MQDDPLDLSALRDPEPGAREERVVHAVMARIHASGAAPGASPGAAPNAPPPDDFDAQLLALARPALAAAAILMISALGMMLRAAPRSADMGGPAAGSSSELLRRVGPLAAIATRSRGMPSASEVILSMAGPR